jgi:hypothetical protein
MIAAPIIAIVFNTIPGAASWPLVGDGITWALGNIYLLMAAGVFLTVYASYRRPDLALIGAVVSAIAVFALQSFGGFGI